MTVPPPSSASCDLGGHPALQGPVSQSTLIGFHASHEQLSPSAAASLCVRPEDVAKAVLVSSDLAWHAAQLREDLEHGFDHLMLHNVDLQQRAFIEAFGERVLPLLSPPRP